MTAAMARGRYKLIKLRPY